jgi:hypothetical protein
MGGKEEKYNLFCNFTIIIMLKMTEFEIWKPVKGYEDLYMVSNYGRIKALPKIVVYKNGRMYKYEEKILVGNNSNGYRTISLVKNKSKITNCIHILVGQAFIENPDNKPVINHLDGNRANNFYKNLEWATSSENQYHSYNILCHKAVRGESNGQSKLKADEVIEIRELYASGKTLKAIANKYDVCAETIRKIIIGKTWSKISALPSNSNILGN